MASSFPCNYCHHTFTRKSSRDRHIMRLHQGSPPSYDCQLCGVVFEDLHILRNHYATHREDLDFKQHQSVFRGVVKSFTKRHRPGSDNVMDTLARNKEQIRQLILNELNLGVALKIGIVMIANFFQFDQHQRATDQTYIPFRSKNFEVRQYVDFEEELQDSFNMIERRIEDFQENGSGWVLHQLLRTNVEVSKTRSLNGSAGFSVVRSQKDISKVKADGEDCFYFAVAHTMTKQKNQSNLQKYIKKKLVRVSDEPMMHVRDIPTFLKRNPALSLRINVMHEQKGEIFPIFCSKNVDARKTLNLLLHKVRDEEGGIQHHFSVIAELSKFLRKSYEGGASVTYEKSFTCANCLGKFSSRTSLKNHEGECLLGKTQRVVLSEEDITFTKETAKFDIPFIGFFDFEAVTSDQEASCLTCRNPEKCIHNKTAIQATQDPCTYSYIIVDKNKKIIHKRSYSGPDPINHMLSSLLTAYDEKILPLYQDQRELKMTEEDEQKFSESMNCHICGDDHLTENGTFDKVRDHDHYTGEFVGSAHQECNLLRQDKKIIPMFAHNFSGYDGHMMLKHLNMELLPQDTKISSLPLNTEKVRTLQIGKFNFLDSYSFLQGSLDELTRNLTQATDDLEILDQMNLSFDDESRELLLRKGKKEKNDVKFQPFISDLFFRSFPLRLREKSGTATEENRSTTQAQVLQPADRQTHQSGRLRACS